MQFGDADADDPGKAKPLGEAKAHLPAEFHRGAKGLAFDRLGRCRWLGPRSRLQQWISSGPGFKGNRAWMTTVTARLARDVAWKRTAAPAPNCTW